MPSVGRAAEPYAPDEARTVQARLNTRLAAADISYRPAAQGTVAYLEGWKAFNLANEVFGFNGWSSEILSLTTDFEDTDAQGRVSLGMSCMVRIHLKDGTFHDVLRARAPLSPGFLGHWLRQLRKPKVPRRILREGPQGGRH